MSEIIHKRLANLIPIKEKKMKQLKVVKWDGVYWGIEDEDGKHIGRLLKEYAENVVRAYNSVRYYQELAKANEEAEK